MKWLGVLLACTAVAHADDPVARDAFRRAQELENASPPRWAEACPLYEASYRADPQIGVLLYLANCQEQVGKLASAWAAFNDAADLARTRGDNREAIARQRADALGPKLSKLLITAPPSIVPGLVVKRDGVDITVLVGKELPIDPGKHQITASAPTYTAWTHEVDITAPGTTTLPIPALDKAPEPPAIKHEGTLTITTRADADIFLDGERKGTGSYTGTVTGNTGHSLRVVAPHMRLYQNDVFVGDGQTRTIDVALEAEAAAPHANTPAFELAASLAPGVKLRRDNPIVLALRAEAALWLGGRVNLGIYGEYGRIDTSGRCGTDISGPAPATPFDIGQRHQLLSCAYLMPGLQLYIHVLPTRRIDPYFGVAPGFRFGSVSFKTTFGDMPIGQSHQRMLAIVTAVRVGVAYHRTPTWTLGGYVDGSITIIGDDEDVDNNGSGVGTYLTVFAGARSTVLF